VSEEKERENIENGDRFKDLVLKKKEKKWCNTFTM
jgi:hypothetical protein